MMIASLRKPITKFFAIIFIIAGFLFFQNLEVRADHTLDTSQQNSSLTANPSTFTYTSGSGSTVIVLNLVVVGATARTGGAPTYNGVTMTQADSTRIATETNIEMWYLLNPPTGSAYTVSIPNTNTRTIHAFTVTAKAQSGYTSALNITNGATGTTANPSVAVTTTANGDFVTSVVGHGINTTTGITGNKTQYGGVWLIDHGNIASLRMYELQAVSGLTTHTFTVVADDWGMIVTAFKQVPLVTTIADGGTPGSAIIAPESGIVDLDYFTLATDIGTDTVTAITVSLSPLGAFNNIAQVDITDNSNVARCTAVTGLTSNTVSFSTCTSNGGIPVATSATTYKVRITPKTHEFMPSPATGASYATTGTVTAFTSTNASHVLTDTSSATLTIDNLSPGASTGASATPGDTQITVSWTNPADADFSNLVVLRDTATIGSGSAPAEGSSPTVGSSCGGTACQVRYISSGTSFIDTSLSNGTTYYYRIFAKDTRGNYTAYASAQQVSATPTAAPDATPPTPNPMTFATAPANDSTTQISMTSTVGSDASSPVSYLFTNDNSTCGGNAGTGGTTSTWQVSTSYSDSGLSPNKCYGYTVTARDSLSNTGTASSISSTYTSANTPGTPTLSGAAASTLNLTNAENSNPSSNPTTNFAVQVVTTSPSDATWLNKWINTSGNPSATAVWMTDAQLDSLVLQGLQTNTTYGVKVKARNQDNDETALSAEGQGTTSSTPTTTLGNGTDPASATITPGTAETDVNEFTLQTNTGTETVSSITVNLSTGSGVALLSLTDVSNATIGSIASPSAGPNTIPVNIAIGTSGTTFKVRVTPFSHTAMPAPSGGAYAITATTTAWVGSYAHTGTDTNANALTIDNLSPGNVPASSATAGDGQVSLGWTNPTDTDFTTGGTVLVLRSTSVITDTPTEGLTYSLGGSVGSSIAVCVISGTPPATTCTDTGLTNGTAYHYRVFTQDSRGNYSATGIVPSNSPATPSSVVLPTFIITATAGTGGTVLPAGDTSVTQGNSQTYTITPNSGYTIDTLSIDGATTTPATSYTFTGVTVAHTINATFASIPGAETPVIVRRRLASITFSGKAFPGGKISVVQKQLTTENISKQQDTTDVSGYFNFRFADMEDGTYSFGLLIKDPEGRTSQTKFFLIDATRGDEVFKDIVAPPTIDIISGQVSRGGNIKIFGYASPSHTIRVYLNDILVKEVLAGRGGVYSFDLPTGALEFGQYKVRTKQINLDGGRESDFSTLRTVIVSKLAVVKADFSGDGKVDIKDWSIFLARWGAKSSLGRDGIDLNSDGKVDIADFSIFIKTIRKK